MAQAGQFYWFRECHPFKLGHFSWTVSLGTDRERCWDNITGKEQQRQVEKRVGREWGGGEREK